MSPAPPDVSDVAVCFRNEKSGSELSPLKGLKCFMSHQDSMGGGRELWWLLSSSPVFFHYLSN